MIYNQWYAVMPSKDVKKGKILAAKRLGLELVFFRLEDGTAGCVMDKCTHRGAALSKGRIVDGCVQCPFHGLRFDEKGKCRMIPANGIASKQDLTRYNVKHFPLVEKHDIIYIWYGDEDKVSDEVPFFDDHVDESFSYSEIQDYWNSHYSRCIENQLDVVHLPFVHHNTIGRGNKTLVNGPKVIVEDRTIVTSANNEVDMGQAPKKSDECTIKPTYLKFIFPNIWMNHISEDIKVIIYFAPVDDENTILNIRFYCRISKFRPLNAMIAFFGKFGNRTIERQDKRVVITQKPKASSLRSGEKLVPGDRPIVEYRRIRNSLKKENNPE